MKLVGLTGGIGMGKSTVTSMLEQSGVPVVDTDMVAREIVEPGQPALAEITAAFGAEVISADGRLRRDEVARRVFSDEVLRHRLEAITHPRIRAAWRARVEEWRTAGRERAAVVIPLLFETAAEKEFDAVLCVACSARTQQERLRARGWSDEEIRQRKAAQWPVEKKLALCHGVIWTEGVLEVTATQVARFLDRFWSRHLTRGV
jgi:dephospho-CoA kinase